MHLPPVELTRCFGEPRLEDESSSLSSSTSVDRAKLLNALGPFVPFSWCRRRVRSVGGGSPLGVGQVAWIESALHCVSDDRVYARRDCASTASSARVKTIGADAGACAGAGAPALAKLDDDDDGTEELDAEAEAPEGAEAAEGAEAQDKLTAVTDSDRPHLPPLDIAFKLYGSSLSSSSSELFS